MAKLSMIEREKKREKLNKKYLTKINMIKDKLNFSKALTTCLMKNEKRIDEMYNSYIPV